MHGPTSFHLASFDPFGCGIKSWLVFLSTTITTTKRGRRGAHVYFGANERVDRFIRCLGGGLGCVRGEQKSYTGRVRELEWGIGRRGIEKEGDWKERN